MPSDWAVFPCPQLPPSEVTGPLILDPTLVTLPFLPPLSHPLHHYLYPLWPLIVHLRLLHRPQQFRSEIRTTAVVLRSLRATSLLK